MFWHKSESPKIVEKISIYPTPSNEDTNEFPVRPSSSNFNRYQALMYTGVAAISLATMIALIGVKPMAYLVLKGKDPLPSLPEISNLVADCYSSYDACYDFPRFKSNTTTQYETDLNQLAKDYDINPILLTALAIAINSEEIPSESVLREVAQTFSTNRQNSATNAVPQILETKFGSFRLKQVNQATYLSVVVLQSLLNDKQAFTDAVLSSPDDDIPNNLSEIIETIL